MKWDSSDIYSLSSSVSFRSKRVISEVESKGQIRKIKVATQSVHLAQIAAKQSATDKTVGEH